MPILRIYFNQRRPLAIRNMKRNKDTSVEFVYILLRMNSYQRELWKFKNKRPFSHIILFKFLNETQLFLFNNLFLKIHIHVHTTPNPILYIRTHTKFIVPEDLKLNTAVLRKVTSLQRIKSIKWCKYNTNVSVG